MIKSKKLSKFKDIEHAFFNRLGGKSTGIYKSLNCGLGSLDNKKNILKNLQIVKKKIKINSKNIFLTKQNHSNQFCYLDKNFIPNRKKFNRDAIITNKKNLPIGVLTADCAPILIVDQKIKMIAAVHAGWRGAYNGIIKNVVNFMIKKGCTSKNITAVIGPCIAFKNYEVKDDFFKRFIKKDKKNKIFFKKIGNKKFFSLNRYIEYQLKSLNIKKIDIIKRDTFNIKNNFFSARRSNKLNENDYGRNISIIMIN